MSTVILRQGACPSPTFSLTSWLVINIYWIRTMFGAQEQYQLTNTHDNSLISTTPRQQATDDRPQHYYIEQENSKGRFIPNLLLLDKLHSKVDSSSNTLLGHMCSYNSPYLPLLIDSLPHDDELINKRNNFGNSPVEIAALYSTKEVVDKLKSKGATGDIGCDYWAIRGGNLAVWSGQVPLDRPELVHWAAYNDMPEVLEEFRKKGVSLSTPDQNGQSPIDISVSNKAYRAYKYLLGLGYLPTPDKLIGIDSKAMTRMYEQVAHPRKYPHPMFAFALLLFMQYYLFNEYSESVLLFCELLFFVALSCSPPPKPRLDQSRTLHFYSKLLKNKIQWGNNHLAYMLFNMAVGLVGLYVLKFAKVESYLSAFFYWVLLVSTLCFMANFLMEMWCVSRNLTHQQMFQRHLHPQLYRKLKVVKDMGLVYHEFHNPRDTGLRQNWKYYCSLY